MFSGPNLERWTIKLLTGQLESGNAMLDGKRSSVQSLPGGSKCSWDEKRGSIEREPCVGADQARQK